MESAIVEALLAAGVFLVPAMGGIYIGMGERAPARVRALSASAFLLIVAGCVGVGVVATRTPGGAPTVLFGFLALWVGVVLGSLLAVVAAVAGAAHALNQRHWSWFSMLAVGALLPLVLAALLLGQELDPRHGLVLVRWSSASAALVSALLLVALAPLVTLIYGLWIADERERAAHAPFHGDGPSP